MPSLLAKFHRSPSRNSDHSNSNSNSGVAETHQRHRSDSSSSASFIARHSTSNRSSTPISPSSRKESLFIEEFGGTTKTDSPTTTAAPQVMTTSQPPTPAGKPRPSTLSISSRDQSAPKVMLTEDGATSPRSLKSAHEEEEAQTSSRRSSLMKNGDMKDSSRKRPASLVSRPSNAPSRSSSFVNQDFSPGRERRDTVSFNSTTGKKDKKDKDKKDKSSSKKHRKSRSKSISSAISGQSGSIAAALAKSGLHIAGAPDSELVPQISKTSSNRSPFLVRGNQYGDEEAVGEDMSEDVDFDSDSSDLDNSLPVTGFAVASNRRQSEFHNLFPAVDEGDYLIEDYGCALSKDILVHGRLYVSENHICFHANIFGWITDLVIPFTDIRSIEKKMTALVIPNAIGVSTKDAKYTMASFISRDSTYDVLMNIWRLCNPNAVMSTSSFQANGDSAADDEGPKSDEKGGGGKGGHAVTECKCGKEGKHYSEVAMNTTFPSTPEKIYNLMFNSGWLKEFLRDSQKLRDIESSDWEPQEENRHLTRSMSYIKPLNGSIGPKQTKCHITDELEHCDYDHYVTVLTTTKTPDVPSGGVFSVKTRSCLMWGPRNSTKVIVTTTVEWTGKSWVKGIIEKSAVDGQKQYHEDLENSMRAHIKDHSTEFYDKDVAEDEIDLGSDEEKPGTPTAAEAYAAEQRKSKHDRDAGMLQSGLDNIVAGSKAIFSGLGSLFSTLSEYLNDLPGPQSLILVVVIFLLVISNIYTYYAYRSTSKAEMRRAKRLGYKYGFGDDDISEAMKLLWTDRSRINAFEQAKQLDSVLDEVERRLGKLRHTASELTEA